MACCTPPLPPSNDYRLGLRIDPCCDRLPTRWRYPGVMAPQAHLIDQIGEAYSPLRQVHRLDGLVDQEIQIAREARAPAALPTSPRNQACHGRLRQIPIQHDVGLRESAAQGCGRGHHVSSSAASVLSERTNNGEAAASVRPFRFGNLGDIAARLADRPPISGFIIPFRVIRNQRIAPCVPVN
jgi:hypothetical protein